MKRILARRPSPALIIACIALFVSLGGVSYGVATGFIDSREIKNNTIRTQDLRNNDVRGRDIRNSTIGGRDIAFNTITGQDVNESKLGKVPDADKLDGASGEAYVHTDTTGFAPLTLHSDWGPVTDEPAPAYDVDPFGYVHLQGVFERDAQPADETILVLPPGARPDAVKRFAIAEDDGTGNLSAAFVTVETSGEVKADGVVSLPPAFQSLDGLTFKAAGA